ncbi:very short patch repair endonuclease [Bradyrhizobium sp. SZCCHNR1015]|uniref:very short patch repair endonuclease n=1 Tax=Bradyrhizobium sp. SZCCHNR1015 TaxID=3057338 RepID=UPI003967DC8D
MSRIKSKGNLATEVKLIELFRESHIVGWRRNSRLFGKPDFVFASCRIAVFVDGCFWHGCALHSRLPKTNRSFWAKKLERNLARDLAVNSHLRLRGWRVLRIWQHELKDRASLVRKIKRSLSMRQTC